jgi:transposase
MTFHRGQLLNHAEDRAQLEQWVRAATTPQRVVWRSRIVLLGLDGHSASEIAAQIGVSHPTVRLWLRRFANAGANALLHDAPGRGRHPLIDPATLMTRLREAHLVGADGQPTSLRDAAKYLGVSASTVWRALRKHPTES